MDGANDGILEAVRERDATDGVIAVLVDASAAMPYHQNKGGRIQLLTEKSEPVQIELKNRRITTLVYHIPGVINPADKPSRTLVGISEYMINPTIFKAFNAAWGPITLDAVAARWNRQVETYCTFQRADMQAQGFDFMAQQTKEFQLNGGVIWVHPPQHRALIEELVRRVELQCMEVIMLVPLTQSSYLSSMVPLLTKMPVLIDVNDSTMLPPAGYSYWDKETTHRLPVHRMLTSKTWTTLIGARLSGSTKSRGAWNRSWHQQLNLYTNKEHERTKHAERILLDHGEAFSPTSQHLDKSAKLLYQILCSATSLQ
jgi:hypothetical protein